MQPPPLLQSRMTIHSSIWKMGIGMVRNKSHSNPKLLHKEEARREVEEEEMVREEDSKEETTRSKIISIADRQTEVDGNPEAHECWKNVLTVL